MFTLHNKLARLGSIMKLYNGDKAHEGSNEEMPLI